ncbi:MAG: bifunctional aspartate kinase/homoserine dehydrogenase I, partial [Muribaculaceae bacterium]|nr:bifunctional aspartate kinase/homoserine dehydrogenase I [Muribaculaceae bacterium]
IGIKNICEIIAAEPTDSVVVVSALAGVTDLLLETARQAAKGNEDAYRDNLRRLQSIHFDLINQIFEGRTVPSALKKGLTARLGELQSLLYGVYLLRDLSWRSRDLILSYGEISSALILSSLIEESQLHDAREFIKTEHRNGRNHIDLQLTSQLIARRFLPEMGSGRVHIVPGFIASDSTSGQTTTLGRGGSDYTASIIAATLNAEALEIWTNVDGFLTADPRVVDNAYTIKSLTYAEATELCNFGAKVLYPPAIFPVCKSDIPIYIKNTYNPGGPGTIITSRSREDDRRAIKGVSSIKGTSLITVAGLSMVGVIGVNQRIFSALAANGISVFMVSQASSENSTSIGVRDVDASAAVEVLNREFDKEIATGAMYPMRAESGLATMAIVGENMRHTAGIAGKLFRSLGRNGISVIACAQGASETNISFVIEGRHLRKALNVLHDSFFLSEYTDVNIFLCGVGTVGRRLVEQIASQQTELMETHRLKLKVISIASSRKALFDLEGIDLSRYRELLDQAPESDPKLLADTITGLNLYNSVFVDCTASADIAAIYPQLLAHNISVVAANKIAASGPYALYRSLKETALRRGVKFLFETNVGAGLPLISTINDLRSSGDKILKIEAVLSGTLNYIFNALSADTPLSEAVKQAKELGYSEPDPRIDLSGIDVLRKLVILTREAGYAVEQAEVEREPFIPQELFDGSVDDFWRLLPGLDKEFEDRRRNLEAEGKRLRFVASMERGKMKIGLQAVDESHPFYRLEGSTNNILLTTARYREYPMQIQGYGAGAEVTAAGVFANLISTANA